MAITRRQFLKRTGLATAGTLLGPGLFAQSVRPARPRRTIGNRYFVVLFLDGGNDGLNTVIPVDNGGNPTSLRTALRDARKTGAGGIRMTPAELANSLDRRPIRSPAASSRSIPASPTLRAAGCRAAGSRRSTTRARSP